MLGMVAAEMVRVLANRRGMTGRQRFTIIALLATLAILFVVAACASKQGIPPLELQAQRLNKAIMCPICPGESIDQSRASLAAQMRAIVVDKLEQGWTGDQIKDFFVERYGPSVLLKPPGEGFSLMVWVIPPVVLLGAGIVFFLVLRFMRGPLTAPHRRLEDTLQLADEERDEYFRRIERALDNGEDEKSPSGEKGDPELESPVRDSNLRSD